MKEIQTRGEILAGLRKLHDQLGIEVALLAAEDIERLMARCNNFEGNRFFEILNSITNASVQKYGLEFGSVEAGHAVNSTHLIMQAIEEHKELAERMQP